MTLSDPTIKSSLLFDTIQSSLSSMSASEKAATLKRVNAIFEIKIKGKDGKPEKSWTLDFKKVSIAFRSSIIVCLLAVGGESYEI